ncbi:AsmA family protein [Variovorax sp. J22R133]|uniref:AsmA family protein n=1 Tax=Variovorax brevis TaxID=3053503 RepID=UPI002576E298|nr:AsmA family protein [Variovorax sp. J22R133]MDM0116540.1 AsmA family protein [Variovorax sp. J22R133]
MKWTWVRRLLLGVVLLALLAAGGVWLLVQSIDRGAVMARAVQEVKTATGRDFAIDGKVRFQLFPNIALVAEGVRLGNTSWGSRPDMARIRQLEMHVALKPLLSRRVEIRSVEVHGVDLLLETNASTGQGNWNIARADADPGADTQAEPKAPGKVQVTLSEFIAHDSVLAFHSGRSGRTETIRIEALSLANVGEARPAEFNQLDLDVVFHEQKIHLEGRVGTVRAALAANRSVPLDLALTMEGTTATVKGDVDLGRSAGQARMRVDASVRNAAALNRIVGVALPVPLPATVRADLNWRARELVVDPIELETNGQSIGGRIVWDRAASPPELDIVMRADSLDLARLYREPATPPAAAAASGRVFSETPFPAIHLPELTIKTEMHVERLVLPTGLELTSLQGKATAHPDRVDVAQFAFGLARGTFSVSGSVHTGDGREAPRVSASVKARNVAMDALLALLRRQAVIAGGRTQMDANLSASGSSLHAIADSLDGEVRLKMGAAQSVPRRTTGAETLLTALMRALTPMRRPDEPVKISCAAARLPVRNGTIVVDRSIAAESERLDIVMSGEIDLGAERIDLAMRPTVKKGTGLDPSSFAGLVKVVGTLSHPTVEVNMAGTAREAASISAAVATGGATLLGQRLLGKVTDPHPCDSAYNGSASTSAESPKTAAPKKKGLLAPIRNVFGG